MTLLVFYIITALLLSFTSSLIEAVILSVSQTYIAKLVRDKHPSGSVLKKLKGNIDRPLAAILTFNAIGNTLGAAGIGAEVLKLYGDIGVAVSSFLLTFVLLVMCEILPKTLGTVYWRTLAPYVAFPILGMTYVTYPLVVIAKWIAARFRLAKPGPLMTREELILMTELSEADGTLLKKEALIIKNLLRLSTILVEDIMTPRSVLSSLPQELTVAEAVEKYSLHFSRIPIFKDDPDNLTGVVHRFQLLEHYSNGHESQKIQQLASPIQVVMEKDTVSNVIELFIKQRAHLLAVKSASGKISGIVTLEDAIETLLGVEILDEFDSVADLRQYASDLMKRHHEKAAGLPMLPPKAKR